MRCEKVLYKRTAHIFKDFSVLREENKYNYLQTYPVVQDSWYHNFEITDCFHAETGFRYLQEDKLSVYQESQENWEKMLILSFFGEINQNFTREVQTSFPLKIQIFTAIQPW